jgi:transporter family-2 protein
MATLFTLAAVAGAAIAVQAGMNAQLGVILRSPLLASCIAFSIGALVTALVILASGRVQPTADVARSVPGWLWLGGMFSALGVGLFYYLIPRMGVGPMMSVAVSSQLLIGVLASHFGWFELPVKTLDAGRAFGLCALAVGVFLINEG